MDDARVGDTITISAYKDGSAPPPTEALPGYREPVPMVYCGLFPTETTQYQLLRDSLGIEVRERLPVTVPFSQYRGPAESGLRALQQWREVAHAAARPAPELS